MIPRRRIVRKILAALLIIIVLIAGEFLFFQVAAVNDDCPGLSYNTCWIAYYTPPLPTHCPANGCIALLAIRTSIMNAYGFNESLLTRIVDYYKLMLTFNFQYNVGTVMQGSAFVSGAVSNTLETEVPFTLALILPAVALAMVLGDILGAVPKARGGRPRSGRPIGTFLLLDVALVAMAGWGVSRGYVPSAFSSWYAPFASGTSAGLAYYGTALIALSLPLAVLTLVTTGSLLAVRLACGGRLRLGGALCVALLTAILWGVVIEAALGWPGLGWTLASNPATVVCCPRGYYVIGEDYPLDQAAAFVLSLWALVTTLVVSILKEAPSSESLPVRLSQDSALRS